MIANGPYAYEGPPPVGPQDAADALVIIEGAQASAYPDVSEQEDLAALHDEYQAVLDAGSIDVLEDPDALYFYTIYFLIFELPAAHIGDIPPPFPSE